MTPENKRGAKPPNVKSRQAALEKLTLAIADIVLRLQMDPKEKSNLLASAAAVARKPGLHDTGWVDEKQLDLPKGGE